MCDVMIIITAIPPIITTPRKTPRRFMGRKPSCRTSHRLLSASANARIASGIRLSMTNNCPLSNRIWEASQNENGISRSCISIHSWKTTAELMMKKIARPQRSTME